MKRINISESQFNNISDKINEISYRTVSKASSKGYKLFQKLYFAFSDFEDKVNDVYEDDELNNNNPYMSEIKRLTDEIGTILKKKYEQTENFESEMDNFDRDKFYDSDDAEDKDLYDHDLSYLQRQYKK